MVRTVSVFELTDDYYGLGMGIKMEKLADRLTDLLLRNHIIEETEREVYSYGFQITMANLINAMIAFSLGLLTGSLLRVIVFYLVFVLARQYNGGYHANTYGKCFASFAGCICGMLVLSGLLEHLGNPWWVLAATYLLYGAAVWRISPCPNEQVPLSGQERARYRKISWGILLAAGCVNILLTGFRIDTYSSVITTTVWEVTFLMWLGRRAYERIKENTVEQSCC